MKDLEEGMKELITKGVEKAIEKAKEALRQSLTEWAIERQTKAAKQTVGHINKSREYQESLTMNDKPYKFRGSMEMQSFLVPINDEIDKGVEKPGPGSTNTSISLDKHYKHDKDEKVNTLHQLAKFDKIMVYKFHEDEYGKFYGIPCNNLKNILNTTEVFVEISVEDKIAFMMNLWGLVCRLGAWSWVMLTYEEIRGGYKTCRSLCHQLVGGGDSASFF